MTEDQGPREGQEQDHPATCPHAYREALRTSELQFVAARYHRDGSGANFRAERCTGISSDALAWYGVGMRGEPKASEYPRDRSDLAACERTFEMAPEHVQERMRPVLLAYRASLSAVSA